MPHPLFALLPSTLRTLLEVLPQDVVSEMEEIRIREGRPLEIITKGGRGYVTQLGELEQLPAKAYIPTRDDSKRLLDLLTQHSLYSFEEELRRGYITVRGGHRVGLAGRTLLEDGSVKLIRDITSFNIRVAREVIGCGAPLFDFLQDSEQNTIHHTLILSPPQCGKTTMLRDLARLSSRGDESRNNRQGWKVGIVDERSELAACYRGVPIFDVGPRTDVLDACPKAEGMMMLIRSMSPDILVTDEIGRAEDVTAIHEALYAGIRVITSAHAAQITDAYKRPVLRKLLMEHVFSRLVVLSRDKMGINRFTVFDQHGNRLGGNDPSRLCDRQIAISW